MSQSQSPTVRGTRPLSDNRVVRGAGGPQAYPVTPPAGPAREPVALPSSMSVPNMPGSQRMPVDSTRSMPLRGASTLGPRRMSNEGSGEAPMSMRSLSSQAQQRQPSSVDSIFQEDNMPPPIEAMAAPRKPPASVARIMGVGFLIALVLVSMPLMGGLILLEEPTFHFWMGERYAWKLIFISVSSVVLLGFVLLIIGVQSFSQATIRLLASLSGLFCVLLGVLLVLCSLMASSNLHGIANRIDGAGCRSSMEKVVGLMDYSVVLYNLRMTPACFVAKGVEDCQGWAENSYTKYLRFLEEEFDCGPLCPEEPAPQLRPAVPGSGLLDVEHRGRRKGRESQGARLSQILALDQGNPLGDPSEVDMADIRTGDIVRLDKNGTFVKQLYESEPGFIWHKEMDSMLGQEFKVLKPAKGGMVGLPSPDGSQDGVWYFPEEALQLMPPALETPLLPVLHAASLKLFSPGSTSMTCLPMISTRLRVLAFTFASQFLYHGVLLMVIGIACAVLGLCRGFDNPHHLGSKV